jgi:hypothetical protein
MAPLFFSLENMTESNIERKSLDNKEFLQLRQSTDKIAAALARRLKDHLATLRPLFIPRKLLGTYIKSSSTEEISGSDKAFAKLQEKYGLICEDPFKLPKKLQTPLPAISHFLESTPYQYNLALGGDSTKEVKITAPTRFILSFQSECPLNRLRAMLSSAEGRQPDDMRQALVSHLALVLFLEQFPQLVNLLKDLRYTIEIEKFADLGGLPAVILTAPLSTFLPPDDFITEITQLSGIPAFQEIISIDAVQNMPDPLRDALQEYSR